jgi:hypothetical protein
MFALAAFLGGILVGMVAGILLANKVVASSHQRESDEADWWKRGEDNPYDS